MTQHYVNVAETSATISKIDVEIRVLQSIYSNITHTHQKIDKMHSEESHT